MVTVRLFAAAREAAGAEVLEVAAGPAVACRTSARGSTGFVAMSTLLCDGVRIAPGDAGRRWRRRRRPPAVRRRLSPRRIG
ncbi:MAG: hypothetical protein V9G10_05130 [Candidatus Nanopelagicales bacterium]